MTTVTYHNFYSNVEPTVPKDPTLLTKLKSFFKSTPYREDPRNLGIQMWVSQLEANLKNVGLEQTTDTGQINLAVPLSKDVFDSPLGFQIYRTSIHDNASIKHLYIKFEYGVSKFYITPVMWITVGTDSDGCGNVTGHVSPRRMIHPLEMEPNNGNESLRGLAHLCLTPELFALAYTYETSVGDNVRLTFSCGLTTDENGVLNNVGHHLLSYQEDHPGGWLLDCVSHKGKDPVTIKDYSARFAPSNIVKWSASEITGQGRPDMELEAGIVIEVRQNEHAADYLVSWYDHASKSIGTGLFLESALEAGDADHRKVINNRMSVKFMAAVEESPEITPEVAQSMIVTVRQFTDEEIVSAFRNLGGMGWIETDAKSIPLIELNSKKEPFVTVDACLTLRDLKMLIYLMERNNDLTSSVA